MQDRYWLYQRNGIFYVQDRSTGKQESLRTRDHTVASRLFSAKNQAFEQPALNISMAKAYLSVKTPEMAKRTWKEVMEEIEQGYQGPTLLRWRKVMISPPFQSLKKQPLLETEAHHFLKVLRHPAAGVSTNVQLRILHNRALALGWLLTSVLSRAAWPKVRYGKKRAIAWEEHQQIVQREREIEADSENRLFYEMLWETGGSQSDIACLHNDNIDPVERRICYRRKKREGHQNNGAVLLIGVQMRAILDRLPKRGFLFPRLAQQPEVVRASKFRKRCLGLGIQGVTLHSYRYAWAERAKEVGMPLREAMAYLGHNSKAIHQAYADKIEVVTLPLEYYEEIRRKKVVEFHKQTEAASEFIDAGVRAA